MQQFALYSLQAWFERLIPALFPLMFLSNLCIQKNYHKKISSFLYPLFHSLFPVSQNGVYAILTGYLFGFPMGAKVIGQLYLRKEISLHMAQYLLSFCNHLSPVFMITIVLPLLHIRGLFAVFTLLLFYGVPFVYGVIYGFIFFRKKEDQPQELIVENTVETAHHDIMETALTDAISSIMKLGGYMVFWGSAAGILHAMIPNQSFFPYLYPALEITTGLFYTGYSPLQMLIYCSFGGLSCLLQTKSVLSHTGISILSYMIHKAVQIFIIVVLYLIFHP